MINFANDIEDMEQKQITATYAEAVKAIKEAILESRYRAARLVNKEVLALYYAIGGYISVQSRAARWGSKRITGTVLLIHVNNRTRNKNVLITKTIRYVPRKEPYKCVRIINGV